MCSLYVFFFVNLWILQFCMHRKARPAQEWKDEVKKNNWIIAFTGNEKSEQHKQRAKYKERISNRISCAVFCSRYTIFFSLALSKLYMAGICSMRKSLKCSNYTNLLNTSMKSLLFVVSFFCCCCFFSASSPFSCSIYTIQYSILFARRIFYAIAVIYIFKFKLCWMQFA